MEDGRQFKKRYVFVSLTFLLLSVTIFLLPAKYDMTQKQARELLIDATDATRYISSDDLAWILMNKKPGYLIIDVRIKEDFENYTLAGAVNIPFEDVLKKDEKGNFLNEDILSNENIKKVFISNGGIYSSQIRLLLRRLNYKNIYVLEGGLNKWFQTIIKPVKPEPNSPSSELELYNRRLAASIFFGGTKTEISVTPASNGASSASSVVKKDKPKKKGGGGC